MSKTYVVKIVGRLLPTFSLCPVVRNADNVRESVLLPVMRCESCAVCVTVCWTESCVLLCVGLRAVCYCVLD